MVVDIVAGRRHFNRELHPGPLRIHQVVLHLKLILTVAVHRRLKYNFKKWYLLPKVLTLYYYEGNLYL